MFENLSSSEWLLYISEWQHQTQSISNIRVTTKVAVHSLLSNSDDLQIRGAAIIHNLACKEVKTVVCILPSRLTIFLSSLVSSKLTQAILLRIFSIFYSYNLVITSVLQM